MGFSIEKEQRAGLEFILLKNQLTHEFVEIVPSLGGTINRIALALDGEIHQILEHDQDEELKKNPKTRGRLLFPFNDRIPEAKYSWRGKEYQLHMNKPKDNCAIHGFLREKKLEEVDSSEGTTSSSVTLQFSFDEHRFQGYPFSLEFRAKYTLSEKGFALDLAYTNHGKEVAPVGMGWHPYFTINNSIEGAILQCDAQKYVEVDAELLPTGKTPPVDNTEFDFRKGKEVHGVELDMAITCPENGLISLTKDGIKIQLYQKPVEFKYVQLYIPPSQTSIAIEPVTMATNSYNQTEFGVNSVEQGKTVTSKVTVSLG